MNVVFICDESYVMPTTVALTSLIAHKSPAANLTVAIVTTDLQAATPLANLEQPGVFVRLIDGSGHLERSTATWAPSQFRTATKAAMLKFYLPELLPEWDKVLYLDGDILVRSDLTELYQTEMPQHYATVVRDLPQVLYKKQLLGHSRDYFNSGVMVLNLARMRAHNLTAALIEAKESAVNDNLVDQNVFNTVMDSQVIHTLPIYNLCCANMSRRWRRERMLQKINDLYGTSYASFNDLLNQSAVVHFSSREKPWKYHDLPMIEEWDAYYRNTDYGDMPLLRRSNRIERQLHRLARLQPCKN